MRRPLLTLAALLATSAAAQARPGSLSETAPAGALSETALDPAAAAYTRWIEAAERVRGAGQALGAWVDGLEADAAAVADRAVAYFHVQLRHALVAADRWLNAVVAQAETRTGGFAMPDLTVLVAEPVKGIESSGFGWRLDPINDRKKFHKGADYRADRGTPVYAAGAGVVVFAGRQSGYGKVIFLDHGGGLITRYAHLREIGVQRGDAVVADARIGEVGSTGRTTGPHLHFEVRLDGRAVDPQLALELGAMQRSAAPEVARLAALALHPDIQGQSVDAHDPPPDRGRRARSKNRPERSGRRGSRRDRPTS